MNVYDQVLYPSHPQPQTHPDRLATIAALFGLNSAPIDRSRVLEIGCGNGGNLVPMAWALPESEFLGIDLAAQPLAVGQEMITALGLTNIHLRQANLLDLRPGWKQFDYIIAHGFYSWVPAEVRDHLLLFCRRSLAPQGVAFVSYNAYPGCHLRKMVREMMLFHVRGVESAEQRIEQATALIGFLAGSQDPPDEYRQLLKAELKQIRAHDPGHLYHDDLAEVNQPSYFTQFMAHADQHQLQFLGEADFFEMSGHPFGAEAQARLQEIARNRILHEQYLDFLKCRRFRQTLLCQQEIPLHPEPDSGCVSGFFITANLTCTTEPLDLKPSVLAVFETARGKKTETDFPIGKACLAVLSAQGLAGIHFDELASQTGERLRQAGLLTEGEPSLRELLPPFLLRLYTAGVVDFRTRAVPCPLAAGEKPVATPIVRWQIQHGEVVTSLFHAAIQVEDEIGRHLLQSLDGTRNRSELAESLFQLVSAKGALTVTGPNLHQARQTIEMELDKNLLKLARLGLLMA